MQKKSRKKIKLKRPEFKVDLQKIVPKESNKLTYWMALMVLVTCNFVVSVVLIPFLIILETVPLYAIVITFGVMFGSLFKLIYSTIESVDNLKSAATFFIPSIAIINIAVIATIANEMNELLLLQSGHNPAVLGLIYALAFISPFIYKDIAKYWRI